MTDGISASIAAGTTANIVLGRPLEFLGKPTVVRLLLIADAAGLTAQFVFNVGSDQRVPLAAGTPINVAAAAGQGPKDDEDTYVPQVALPAGARTQLNITNPTGGAIVTRYRAIME